jgi:hypothetical protein
MHGEQLIDRVDLDPHARPPVIDGSINCPAMSTNPGNQSDQRHSQDAKRAHAHHLTDESGDHSTNRTSRQLPNPELHKTVNVPHAFVDASLPELEDHGRISPGIEDLAKPIRQRPQNRTEKPGDRVRPYASKVHPVCHDIGSSSETGPADRRIRPYSRCKPPRRADHKGSNSGDG